MQHRVVCDFEIRFVNGGDLRGRGFRFDIEGDAIDDEALRRLIVEDMRLLMVESVEIVEKRVLREAHKRPSRTTQSHGAG